MAHELEIVNGEAKMAYAGDLPWHGLGTKVNPDISVDDMMVAAGLDWEVKKTPIYTQLYDSTTQKTDRIKIPSKWALTRTSDNKVMTISGDNWRPTQNKEAFEFFREFCDVGGAKMETAGSLKGGQNVWALAKLGAGFTLPNGDRTEGYLLFSLPHVVGSSIQVRTTSVRVVCNNTLTFSLNGNTQSEYRQNHMRDFDFTRAREVVDMANQNLASQGNFAKQLQQVKMDKFDAMVFFNSLISEDSLDRADAELLLEAIDTPLGKRSRMGQFMNSYLNGAGAEQEQRGVC
jgi:phage/plasmid-like protein (TIGR03299 family)